MSSESSRTGKVVEQLGAFGVTLEQHTGEPIRSPGASVASVDAHRPRRRWALVGAAVCVVALIGGLLLIDRRDEPEQGTATTPTTVVPAPATTAPVTVAPTVPLPPDLDALVPDDALGLVAAGWNLESRQEEELTFEGTASECEAFAAFASLDGTALIHEIYLHPDLPGIDLDVNYLAVADGGATVSASVSGMVDCPAMSGAAGAVTLLDDPVLGLSGFISGEEFSLVAVVPPSEAASPLVIMLELESEGVTEPLVRSIARMAAAFLGNEAASQPTVPPTVPATVPSTIPDLAVVEAAQGFEIEPTDEVFVLMVSNQSFEDDRVGLQISIDGQVVADDRYVVGSQHTVTTYVVRGLAPGSHELSVTSDTGVSFVSRVRAAEGRPRWAYLTYWYHPDDTDDPRGRYVAVTESDERPALD